MKNGLVGFLSLLIVACDPPGDRRLWPTNSSPDSLYYFQAYERSPLPATNPFRPYDARNFYLYERLNFTISTGTWDGVITNNSPTDSTMRFYTFLKKDVETTPWPVLLRQKRYKLYPLRLTDLYRRGWRVMVSGPRPGL